ncbi:SEL1-like repeat protein [Caenimonas soli]|uniref:SEL1-like repeat protein n=1 Tax=Caenimonas soli TaxID=2735555 RepID=UPI001557DFF5|nr:SEL1-like repeat protein [Caenimonas soli]NPC55755.1 sel1 repeat family protein [Caenimonas soli]
MLGAASTLRRLLAAAAVFALAGAGRTGPGQDVSPPVLDPSRLGEAAPQFIEPPNGVHERAVQRLRADAAAARSRPAAARDAAWLLGLLALHGLAMPQDTAQAQTWFQQARQLGHPLAPAGLAWCAIDGCTGVAQPAAARQWLAPLRELDPGRALYLEWLMENRLAPLQVATPDLRGHSLPPLPRRDLLLRAARAGDVHAQTELGIESAGAGRLQEAIDQFRAASRRSPAAAANAALIGERLGLGAGPPGSQADQWFLQARRYHRGEGVPSNYAEAMRLYEMAAAKGHPQARRMLELIFSRPAPGGGVDIAWMQQLARMDVSAVGGVTLLPPTVTAALQRDPTPLYDLVPAEWRGARRPP